MSDPSVWHDYRYDLQFRVGEYSVASYGVDVRRRVYRLDDVIAASAQPEVPAFPRLEEVKDGVLLTSVPDAVLEHACNWPTELLIYRVKHYRHCYIDMTGGFTQYAGKFSGKTRSGINRKVRKYLSGVPENAFRRYVRVDEMEEFHARARVVSALSYQERLLDCGLPDSNVFRRQLALQAAADNVRAFILFDGERPVSYLYCPVVNDVLLFAHLGYDPAYASQSVGTVLQWLAFESLFAEGRFRMFDFTEGESEYKQLFGTHAIDCSHLLLLRRTWKNRFIVALHRASEGSGAFAVRVLERFGVKDRLKKWLRHLSLQPSS